ncbi:MAG: ATP-binding protein [Bacteroidales bacterium]|nr:ATP-binding protein [Bacteroidales bacterium]MDD3522665.1 ATP-binding protein [Bacteroidales bacterium]MDD4031230.1 ATP-binding protein [Bacteroidales bacterium]MDD4435760.1 ATP-binding protein [Bacteroidales bacterium]MDD5733314.1 ATP-binding protein [Bacteroidales bacterium]
MPKVKEICILSGKGGTGKTSLAAALATLCDHVVVADCDVDAANLHLVLNPDNYLTEIFISGQKAVICYNKCTQCGLCLEYCRFKAIERCPDPVIAEGRVSIVETSCDGCWLCSRICPENAIEMVPQDKSKWFVGNFRKGKMVHARLAPGEENSGKLVSKVREQARKTAESSGADTIIIDGPPGTGCAAIASLTGADTVVVVTEPTGSGLHDLKRILELAGRFHIKIYVVVNKSDLNPDMTEHIHHYCKKEKILVIGDLPFDTEMVRAMVQCQTVTEWAPGSAISGIIKKIHRFLIPDQTR